MQNYTEIADTTGITESRELLLDNTKTVMSNHSGTAFPTTNLQVGMNFYNTTNKILYTLESTGPDVWVRSLDGYVRTQAEFEAQQAANKAMYAGSGFVEWGKHSSVVNTNLGVVNEGLTVLGGTGVDYAGRMYIGHPTFTSNITGVSKTKEAVTNTNGVRQVLDNFSSNDYVRNAAMLPPAPEATNLVTNGTFDTDTSGWTAHSDSVLTVDTNRLKVAVNAGTTQGVGFTSIPTEVGKTYLFEGDYEQGTSTTVEFWIGVASKHDLAKNFDCIYFFSRNSCLFCLAYIFLTLNRLRTNLRFKLSINNLNIGFLCVFKLVIFNLLQSRLFTSFFIF